MKDRYVMIQSPYYGWHNNVENPIWYESSDYMNWTDGIEVADTPSKGYNSDPTVLIEGDTTWVFWRECETSLCDSVGACGYIVVGCYTLNGMDFSEKQVFLKNTYKFGDTVMCPIILKINGIYKFYATHYMFAPQRKNLGLAIWEGTSLKNPDFSLIDTIKFDNPYICDKLLQAKVGNELIFIPKPLKYDFWHFDLFEYNEKLWMVSCAENADNIMLSVAEDYIHFKTYTKPLINNHVMDSKCQLKHRQYYYKPTAFVENNTLHLFFTSLSQTDHNRNELYHSAIEMSIFE